MKIFDKRPKDLGHLFVVGGPGGSGSSTIAKLLARKYSLNYVYGGLLMRSIAKSKGYTTPEQLDDFLLSLENSNDRFMYDKIIDKKILKLSYQPNVLIDSKIFAAIATKNRIACTVKIWLSASIETRVKRTLHKSGKYDLKSELDKNSSIYKETLTDLMRRHSADMNRYQKLYGVEYDSPKLYNDIVVDSSKIDANQTYNLILKMIDDGGYIK